MKLAHITPGTRLGRTIVGVAFIIGGILGFLPILGLWMIPVGLLMLSVDSPRIRRFRRRWTVKLGRRWNDFRSRHDIPFITK